jgi:hypothetical protein
MSRPELTTSFVVAMVILESFSAACLVHLWMRADAPTWKKLVWTLPVLLPVLGPLLYGGMFSVPGRHGDSPFDSIEGITGDGGDGH